MRKFFLLIAPIVLLPLAAMHKGQKTLQQLRLVYKNSQKSHDVHPDKIFTISNEKNTRENKLIYIFKEIETQGRSKKYKIDFIHLIARPQHQQKITALLKEFSINKKIIYHNDNDHKMLTKNMYCAIEVYLQKNKFARL